MRLGKTCKFHLGLGTYLIDPDQACSHPRAEFPGQLSHLLWKWPPSSRVWIRHTDPTSVHNNFDLSILQSGWRRIEHAAHQAKLVSFYTSRNGIIEYRGSSRLKSSWRCRLLNTLKSRSPGTAPFQDDSWKLGGARRPIPKFKRALNRECILCYTCKGHSERRTHNLISCYLGDPLPALMLLWPG